MMQIPPNLISDYIWLSLLNRGAPLNGYVLIEQKGVKGGQHRYYTHEQWHERDRHD